MTSFIVAERHRFTIGRKGKLRCVKSAAHNSDY
jgi:hypothetical protein